MCVCVLVGVGWGWVCESGGARRAARRFRYPAALCLGSWCTSPAQDLCQPLPPPPLPVLLCCCDCSLRELSLEGGCLPLSAEAADQLAAALPQQCRLLVSLVPAQGRLPPAGPGLAEAAAGAPMQGGNGAAPAWQDAAGPAVQRAQQAGAPALEAHLAALQHLRRALRERLVVEEAMGHGHR